MGTSQKSMVQRCVLACLLIVLDIFTVIQASQNGNQMKRTKAFHETSGKRTMKPNGLFGTFKRSFKPNSLFVIPSKRGLKPNGLFVSMKRSLKPNGLFVMGKRGMLKPNGLFGTIKRGLKPNGLFGLQKRGLKPNGLFALSKRAPLVNMPYTWTEQGHPYGIFKGYDQYYQGLEETQENEEDENLPLEYYLDGDAEDYENFEDEIDEENDGEIVEVKRDDSDFWAARGKRSTGIQEADFWATRGKRSK